MDSLSIPNLLTRFGWPLQPTEGDCVVDTILPGRRCFKLVTNPFGVSLQEGTNLNALLKEDPKVGGERLDDLQARCERAIAGAEAQGFDGVLYLLHGACPDHCSPMQFGGFYLEREREILGSASGQSAVFVVGGPGVYLDFVSDLPAHIFGWDAAASGITSQDVRQMRPGAQLSNDPASEFSLPIVEGGIMSLLEKQALAAH